MNELQVNQEGILSVIESLLKQTKQYIKQHDWENGLATAYKATELCTEYCFEKELAWSLEEMARAYLGMGNLTSAKQKYCAIIPFYMPDSYNKLAYIYSTIGVLEFRLGNYNTSLDYHTQAIQYAERDGDLRVRSITYANIVSTYEKLKRKEEALIYSKRSLKMLKQLKKPFETAVAYMNLGVIMMGQNNLSLAISNTKKALRLFSTGPMSENYISCCTNIASLYLNMHQHVISERYLEMAIKACTQFGPTILLAYINLLYAKIHNEKNQDVTALQYCEKALIVAEQYQEKEIIMETYSSFASIYADMEDYKNAYQSSIKRRKIAEELFSKELTDKIAILQAKFNIQQKENETRFLLEKNEKLENLITVIEEQNRELEETNKAKDTILNIVSHDLKNTIGGIQSATDILLSYNSFGKEERNYLDIIKQASVRAFTMVNDILDADRIQGQDYKLELTHTNLNMLLQGYYSTFIMMVEAKKQNFNLTLPDYTIHIKLNGNRFWQILLNLMSNAIKFTTEGGSIQLSVAKDDQQCIIKLKDTGIGIAKSDFDILFTRFTKASRRGTQGEMSTGLGLSIVKRLVELHNGKITLESVVGKGTTFQLLFPLSL